MEKRKVGLFLKTLIFLVNLSALIFILGRNHFLLGTALIIGRWGLFILGLIFWFWTRKRNRSTLLMYISYLALVLIPLEYIVNQINKERLKDIKTNSELSILTYNVFFKNKSPNQIISRVQSANPDILCIQELTPKWSNELNNSLGKEYPFQILNPLNGTHGIGIYSKYKVDLIKELKNDNGLPYAQVARMKIEGKTIGLINVHLASPAIAVENPERFFPLLRKNYLQRGNELNSINAEVNQTMKGLAVIMVGDLNTTEYEPLYREIRTDWADINIESGNPKRHTFPNTSDYEPFLTLDYVLLRGELEGKKSKVIEGGSSDHFGFYSLIGI